MSGLKEIDLHPENLVAGRKYKLHIKGESNPELTIIKEGVFKKLCRIEVDTYVDRTLLALLFLFATNGLPKAVVWHRIKSIEEIVVTSRSSKKEEKGGADA